MHHLQSFRLPLHSGTVVQSFSRSVVRSTTGESKLGSKVFAGLLGLMACSAFAQTDYFVSSSAVGSSLEGTPDDPFTMFNQIPHVNNMAVHFKPGDVFHGGTTFTGLQNVTFDGIWPGVDGDPPILDGSVVLEPSDFNLVSGKYEATVTLPNYQTIKELYSNGQRLTPARFPEEPGQWLRMDRYSELTPGQKRLVDAQMGLLGPAVDAIAVVKTSNFTINTSKVIGQDVNTLIL